MNYIVISPYYPQNFQKFSIELKNRGVNVLGIGQEPYDQLDDRLKNALTEYYKVNNLEDVEEVKRAVAYLFFKHGKIDRIESQNEYWMELDAELREQFNVFGLRLNDLKKTKHKSEMKKYFEKAKVPVVPGYLVEKISDVDKGIKKLGLPVIAKPDNGVGAAATYKIETKDDVEKFKKEWGESTPYFFETFVDESEIVTFDGIVDKDGKILFTTSIGYYYTPLEVLDNLEELDWVYYIEKDLDPKLIKYGTAAVKSFGMKERFFHIEFFRRKNGDYIAIEYNNRPAGAFAIDVYNYTHSADIFGLYADIVVYGKSDMVVDHSYYGLATTRRDWKKYEYTDADIYAKYGENVKNIFRMPVAFAELQGDVMYVLVGKTKKDIDEINEYISKIKK